MEDSAPFEIHNKLLSDLVTEYLDSSKKADRERNFTKWKLNFRNVNDSDFHRKCPILWDLYFLEDKKHIGIGKYDVLKGLLTEIGSAGDRIRQAEDFIRNSRGGRGENRLEYPIGLKIRTDDPFHGDRVIIEADRLQTSEIYWWKIKESEIVPQKLDLRMANYSESRSEEGQLTLIINEVAFDDNGLYYIRDRDEKRQSNHVFLKIKGDLPDVYVRECSSKINLGGTFTMKCHVISIPPARTASWWKLAEGCWEEININCDKYTQSSTDTQTDPVLKINEVDYGDEGTYCLRVNNAVGRKDSKHCDLEFNEDDSTRTIKYFHLIQLGGESIQHFIERETNSSLKTYLTEKEEELRFVCTESQMKQIDKTIKSSESLDISVMYTILKEIPDIQSPSKGWGEEPDHEDALPSDDVERIRIHYQFVTRPTNTHSMSPILFGEKWTDLSQAIQRLNTGVQSHQIDDIYFSELDQSVIKRSLQSIRDKIERELEMQSERETLPVVEIRGPESVRYLKSAELTSTIQSPKKILRAVWQKETTIIDISTKKYRGSIVNEVNPNLVINKMETDDVAHYQLIVANESGMTKSNTVSLKIKEGKPKCEIVGKTCRKVSFGGSTTLKGKVKSYPIPDSLQWYKVKIKKFVKLDLNNEKYHGSRYDQRKPTLVIHNIDFGDYGIYVLDVKNIKGTATSHEVKIEIEGGLPVAQIVVVHGAQEFSCDAKITSTPAPLSIEWQKVVNNRAEKINISLPKYKGSCKDIARPKLVVQDLKPTDTAKYQLVVSNAVGKGRSNQILLHVKSIDLTPLPESDFFAVAIDLGNTYSSYAFSEMTSTKTIDSLTNNKHGYLEKIPTVLLLNENLDIHSFGSKAREEYALLRGKEDTKHFHYFENFMTSIYETKAKSMDNNISIPDSEGRNVNAKIIISCCATYMIERAIRHIREEFAHVLLSNFKFVFTLPTFWALTDEFFRDALSKSPLEKDQVSVILESHAVSLSCQMKHEDTDVTISTAFQKLTKGDKYMIVDIGGETTDITVHSRTCFGKGEDEVVSRYTGPCGGNNVNKKLIDLWRRKYSRYFEQSSDTGSYQHLTDQFQSSVRAGDTQTMLLHAPGLGHDMAINSAELDNLFDEPIRQILQHLKDVFNKEKVDVVIVVGGFAECLRMQSAIKDFFKDKTVLIPKEPGLFMLKGGVFYLKKIVNESLETYEVTI